LLTEQPLLHQCVTQPLGRQQAEQQAQAQGQQQHHTLLPLHHPCLGLRSATLNW
jgi:hypothetical protein